MGNQAKKKGLSQLSREHPTEEEQAAVRALLREKPDPIAAACLGLNMVERQLEELLRAQLKRSGNDVWKDMTKNNGPLSGFYQKCLLGYSMGLYGDDTLANLDIVRHVRNAFAHSKKIISYDHESVRVELQSAKLPMRRFKPLYDSMKRMKADQNTSVYDYLNVCLCCELDILARINRGLKASLRNTKRAKAKMDRLIQKYVGIGALAGMPPGLLAGALQGTYGQFELSPLTALHLTELQKEKK